MPAWRVTRLASSICVGSGSSAVTTQPRFA